MNYATQGFRDLRKAIINRAAIRWSTLKSIYRLAETWERGTIESWTYHHAHELIGGPSKNRDQVLRELRKNR